MPVSVRLLGARPGPIQRDRHINPQPWDDAQVALRLICVSGLGGVVAEWDRVAPALARRGEVLALELPVAAAGLDDSGGLVGAGQKMLRRVVCHDPSPVVLVGHSMGALVAMLTAAAASVRVNGPGLTAPFLPLGPHGPPGPSATPGAPFPHPSPSHPSNRELPAARSADPLARASRREKLLALCRYSSIQ